MIDKKIVERLVKGVTENSDLFVVEIKISKNNNITVAIDGDQGVTISQCVEVSRAIEGNLDREIEDFELSVSSYGLDQPILMLRQYQKYIDKPLELHLDDDTVKRGVLVSVSPSTLVLNAEIVKKNRKSKKMLVGEPIEIPMANIKLAKVIIVF